MIRLNGFDISGYIWIEEACQIRATESFELNDVQDSSSADDSNQVICMYSCNNACSMASWEQVARWRSEHLQNSVLTASLHVGSGTFERHG